MNIKIFLGKRDKQECLENRIEKLRKKSPEAQDYKTAYKIGELYHQLYNSEIDKKKKREFFNLASVYYQKGVMKEYVKSAIRLGDLMKKEEPNSDKARIFGELRKIKFWRRKKVINKYLNIERIFINRKTKRIIANMTQPKILQRK